MTAKDLDKIFEPEDIALIGATEREVLVGLTLMENLLNIPKGKIIPINPNRDTVLEEEAYSSVKGIPDPVDPGVIATPTPTVPELVKDCGEAEVPGLIIITADFRDIGLEGKKHS